MEHDHWFGDDHLRNGVVSRGAKRDRQRAHCQDRGRRDLTSSSKETMPWFPLPMPENEVDLLDGFKRSTRPATVSEKPMPYASLEETGYRGGSGGRERLLLRSRCGRLERWMHCRSQAFPHCLTAATSHVKPKVLRSFSPPYSLLTSQNLPSVTRHLLRENLRFASRLLTHTPLTSAAGPGSGPWSVDRNPAMLHESLLRSPDRLDQHVSLKPMHALPTAQALL